VSRINNLIRSIIKFVKRKLGIGTPEVQRGATHIGNGMEVIGSCGTSVGLAECMEGEKLKLQDEHTIPAKWILRVDKRIHLAKNPQEVESSWLVP
jgi:hypothetical protein